ncbi:hypothetical protein [Fimbriiglobus ruber]|uniref:Uncharacterized protein n=1 Tax=Fimbriiglobus ruber TaxID=1908690 RepID=A0A225DH14_9BACT|nr:hypothetical protein [Fimbriiglobus ruber]OWK40800.1 hypothetical protein FRUB_04692 [Fimbriiglobus ruber]
MRVSKQRAWWAMAAAVGVAIGGLVYRLPAEEPADRKDAPPARGANADAAVKKAILEDARQVYEMNQKRYRALEGPVVVEDTYLWSVRWLEAELDLAADAAAKTAALKGHLERMREVEKMAANQAKAGQGRQSDAVAGHYHRTRAELWLARGEIK